MKLSEIKDEQALDVLAALIEPASEIMADPEIKTAYDKKNAAHAVAVAIRNHKQAVISVMAALDGVPVEQYHFTVLALPIKMLELLNDPDLIELFGSQGQTGDATSSGSAVESTTEN